MLSRKNDTLHASVDHSSRVRWKIEAQWLYRSSVMRSNTRDVAACDTESVIVVVVGGVSIRERDMRRDVGCQARPTNRINHTHSLARSHRRTLSLEHRQRPRAALSRERKLLTLILQIRERSKQRRKRAKSRAAPSTLACQKKKE